MEHRVHEQGLTGLVKADGHIGAQALAQHQHGLEVLQVEGHVRGLAGVVPVVQKNLSSVHRQLCVQRLVSMPCTCNLPIKCRLYKLIRQSWAAMKGDLESITVQTRCWKNAICLQTVIGLKTILMSVGFQTTMTI